MKKIRFRDAASTHMIHVLLSMLQSWSGKIFHQLLSFKPVEHKSILLLLLLLFMYYYEKREASTTAWCSLEVGKTNGRESTSRKSTIEFVPKDAILVGGERFLWCPNAKVGTTTMYFIWKKEFGEFGHNGSKKRCFDNCPSSAWKLMKTANGRQKLLNATSFTIVRNPWDRIRSAYDE